MTRLKNAVKVMLLKELPLKEQSNFLEKEFKKWAIDTRPPIFQNGAAFSDQNIFVSFEYIKADEIPLFKAWHTVLWARETGVSLHCTASLSLENPKTVAHMDANHNFNSHYWRYGRGEIPTKKELEELGITTIYRSIKDPTVEFDLRDNQQVLDDLELRVRNALQETYDAFLADKPNIFETRIEVQVQYCPGSFYYRDIKKVEEYQHETA